MSSFGLNSGAGINPARDMGPRILTALAGWPDTFTVSKQTKAKQNVHKQLNQSKLVGFGLDNLLFITGSGLLVLDPLVVAPRGRTHWDSHLHLPHPDPSSSQGGGTQSQSVADTHPDP